MRLLAQSDHGYRRRWIRKGPRGEVVRIRRLVPADVPDRGEVSRRPLPGRALVPVGVAGVRHGRGPGRSPGWSCGPWSRRRGRSGSGPNESVAGGGRRVPQGPARWSVPHWFRLPLPALHSIQRDGAERNNNPLWIGHGPTLRPPCRGGPFYVRAGRVCSSKPELCFRFSVTKRLKKR